MIITSAPYCHFSIALLTKKRGMNNRPLLLVRNVAVVLLLSGAMTGRAAEPVDFQQQIRPIFAEHCFKCHGPDDGARQAGLRLDVREVVLAERDSGAMAIVPGRPDESQLLLRVTSNDPDMVMPPLEEHNPLSPEQVALLRQWIGEDAPYTDHWAFSAPGPAEVPDIQSDTGLQPVPDNAETDDQADRAGYLIRNSIDAFVADRLRVEGLTMTRPAEYEVLCRRVYLDVIGLLPAPKDVDEFVAAARDDFPIAIEALINRLMQSEHFGEKWARHWLDVARYADSNGYEKDLPRQQWSWRDWVIRAINADMPYDRFIVEQIAGDLLPDRTQDQLVATGFLRNGMINEEGAILPEQFRLEGVFDRMDCIGKSVLGLSIQCAQCHSHKFDPISQDEYYGMFAFLNNTYEAQSPVYSPEQLQKISEIESAIHELEQKCRMTLASYEERVIEWVRQQRVASPKWDVLDTIEQVWVGGVNHPDELTDHSVMVLGHPTTSGDFFVLAEPVLDGVTGLRLEALTHGDLPMDGPGRNDRGTFAVSELRVEARPPGSEDWVRLALKDASADFSVSERVLEGEGEKKEEEKRRVGPVSFLIDGRLVTGWSADRGPGRRNTDSVAVVQFAEPLSRPKGTQLKVSLTYKHNPPGDPHKATVLLGRVRFALTKSADPQAAPYDHAATIAMQKPVGERSPRQQAIVVAAWRQTVPELKEINDKISALADQYPEAQTSVLTMIERSGEHRRETFLLDRGVWNKPKHEVARHVPAKLHPFKAGEGSPPVRDSSIPADVATRPTRLQFARWLVNRQSPLAARVQVNRVWQAIFGSGLVRTPEDFGTRAPQPEHLQLLDWLALDFMDRSWSTKHLIRTILSSATYQQSSRVTRELLEMDPQNRLLARGPRFRAEAEVVRDIVLCVSGLLNRKVGGPSIFPPVPESVLNNNFSKLGYWRTAQGPERYRRGIYLFRQRSMPDPTLTSFDAPNADFACARRVRSNTPLAALVSLNEPIFVEAAQAMALRILREGGATDEERVDYAFRLCLGRNATADEHAELLSLLTNRRRRLAEGWISINAIATGDLATSPSVPDETNPQDAAAWTIASRVLLNLDETLSKN